MTSVLALTQLASAFAPTLLEIYQQQPRKADKWRGDIRFLIWVSRFSQLLINVGPPWNELFRSLFSLSLCFNLRHLCRRWPKGGKTLVLAVKQIKEIYKAGTGLALNAFAFSFPFNFGSWEINLVLTLEHGKMNSNRAYCEISVTSSFEDREGLQINRLESWDSWS